ncbi:hypothetical protein IVB03_03010 [Bradyrhizobium sp. 168]|uniref:hypothetical protein n=1 Tax=Bradyrhizobium sp. 168 TaxID=2782639 RepID=UPI001FF8C630|nr:hypothetical protein [Bradyrhizobium sp. 168]MCK1578578.1 hypothetical protein [Bradyrhizobium sp. 168]
MLPDDDQDSYADVLAVALSSEAEFSEYGNSDTGNRSQALHEQLATFPTLHQGSPDVLTAPLDHMSQGEASDFEAEEMLGLTTLAIGLLSGAWTQQGPNPKSKQTDRYPAKRYFEGALELEARRAIGQLLRGSAPLDSAIRYQLAELFDGLPPHLSFDAAPMARKIVFENVRAGNPNEIKLRNLHLASEFRDLVERGTPRKKAMNEMCKKYGISDTAVKEARRASPSLEPRAFKKRIDRPA